MLKTLRTLTAVAAIAAAGLPQMAVAAPVLATMTFEGVGTLATHYNTNTFGFTTIAGPAVLSTAPGDPAGINPNNNSVIKICSVQDCLNDPITFNIANGLTTDGTANTAIEFDLNVLGVSIIVELQRADNSWFAIDTVPDIAGPSGWQPRVEITVAAGTYKGIRFSGDAAAFAVDNLSFWTDDTTPTTDVPEPASMALVMLALAGAAASSRRRKQD